MIYVHIHERRLRPAERAAVAYLRMKAGTIRFEFDATDAEMLGYIFDFMDDERKAGRPHPSITRAVVFMWRDLEPKLLEKRANAKRQKKDS